MMSNLEILYNTVKGFNASCRMSLEEQKIYYDLNAEYRKETGARVNHSICGKDNLLRKVKAVIDAKYD
tara:strand:- start:1118 stop:1321 length:204 start_codon:yes stop_codon:yes gene_type:complete